MHIENKISVSLYLCVSNLELILSYPFQFLYCKGRVLYLIVQAFRAIGRQIV